MSEAPAKRLRLRSWLWKFVGACFFVAAFLIPLPSGNPTLDQLFDLSHIVVFGCLAWFLVLTSKASSLPRRAAIALCSVAVVGVAIELIQPFFGRRGSWQDVVYDLIGGVIGTAIAVGRRLTRVSNP